MESPKVSRLAIWLSGAATGRTTFKCLHRWFSWGFGHSKGIGKAQSMHANLADVPHIGVWCGNLVRWLNQPIWKIYVFQIGNWNHHLGIQAISAGGTRPTRSSPNKPLTVKATSSGLTFFSFFTLTTSGARKRSRLCGKLIHSILTLQQEWLIHPREIFGWPSLQQQFRLLPGTIKSIFFGQIESHDQVERTWRCW